MMIDFLIRSHMHIDCGTGGGGGGGEERRYDSHLLLLYACPLIFFPTNPREEFTRFLIARRRALNGREKIPRRSCSSIPGATAHQ